MALFRRRAEARQPTIDRSAHRGDMDHLAGFARARQGVEAYIEPRTTVTSTTVILIAHDGEWTRRRVPSARWAHDFCNRLGIPSYDAAVVGVPTRMREFNRQRSQKKNKGNNFY